MKARWWAVGIGLAIVGLGPAVAGARGLDVEVWTHRGDEAVFQPGERMEVEARTSEDAYLLVYEIDAEGAVRLLYPFHNGAGFVAGRRSYPVPPEHSNVDLVAEGPVGQCYVVAIASREPFGELPWYLRPYDMQAEQVGYDGERDDEEGITAEGRIVGDPFVAMERIRRRVVSDAQEADAFGTSYVTYYVHDQVRYPRYLCYDCHRPGRWSWWADFDPYYTHCSVIDYRVNWGWSWGPRYWFGSVPYYTFVVRSDCPPFYRQHYRSGVRFSSWDGWRRWSSLWGDRLVRYKSAPPRDYVPPAKFSDKRFRNGGAAAPPGFIVGDPSGRRSGHLVAGNLDRSTRSSRDGLRGDASGGSRRGNDGLRGNGRGTVRPEGGRSVGGRSMEPRTSPRESRPRESRPRESRPRESRPRESRPREERPRLEWPGSRQGDGARDSRRLEPPGSRQGDGARDSRRLELPGSRREEPAREVRPRVEWPGSRREERARSEPPRFEPPRQERRPAERSRNEGAREAPQRLERPREERGREARPSESWRAPEPGRGHRGRG